MGNTIRIQPARYVKFLNIARQGEDVRKGVPVLKPGISCSPAVVSILAAMGMAEVPVEKLPRVAVFTTGNEVVPVDAPVSAVQIRNSNLHLLKALLKQWDITPFLCAHIKDDKKDLAYMLKQGLSGDIIITCGGVSAGDADYVPEILEGLGVKKLFHKLAIKPGKPIWCGYVPGGTMVFALPGNPFSCLVTFTLFVESFLAHSSGRGNPVLRNLPLIGERFKKSDLDEFFPVSISESPAGITPLTFNGSGDILAAQDADGLALHPSHLPVLSRHESLAVWPLKK
jgi:molybdopterin molybdotransferase